MCLYRNTLFECNRWMSMKWSYHVFKVHKHHYQQCFNTRKPQTGLASGATYFENVLKKNCDYKTIESIREYRSCVRCFFFHSRKYLKVVTYFVRQISKGLYQEFICTFMNHKLYWVDTEHLYISLFTCVSFENVASTKFIALNICSKSHLIS